MTDENKCLRCGKCCYFPTEHDGWKPCRYLKTDFEGMTRCTIYNMRLGKLVNSGDNVFAATVCSLRKNSPYDFKGCPYNSGKKIIF